MLIFNQQSWKTSANRQKILNLWVFSLRTTVSEAQTCCPMPPLSQDWSRGGQTPDVHQEKTKCYEMGSPPRKKNQLFLFWDLYNSWSKDGHGMVFRFCSKNKNFKEKKLKEFCGIDGPFCQDVIPAPQRNNNMIEICWSVPPCSICFSNKKVRHLWGVSCPFYMVLRGAQNFRPPPKLHVCIHVGEIHVAGLNEIQGGELCEFHHILSTKFPNVGLFWGGFHEFPLEYPLRSQNDSSNWNTIEDIDDIDTHLGCDKTWHSMMYTKSYCVKCEYE